MTYEEKLENWKLQSVRKAVAVTNMYGKLAFDTKLVNKALKRRLEYIKNAKSISELTEIDKGPQFVEKAEGIVDGTYPFPEEEMMQWSLASNKAPLNEKAIKRFQALFKDVYGFDAA